MIKKINKYISDGKRQGYPEDIPDECPDVLMHLNLVPSYKAIAIAIMKNDHAMQSLGFSSRKSEYYNVLKKIEIEERNKNA